MKKNFKVKVNDSLVYELNSIDSNNLDYLELSESNYHVLLNKKSFSLKIDKANFLTKEYTVSVNSNSYNVKIENNLDMLIKEMGFTIGSSKITNEIKAPMPGIILSILIKEGQKVKEGDTLLILEAMKMENAIICPKNTVIKEIYIDVGETVDKNKLLIDFQ